MPLHGDNTNVLTSKYKVYIEDHNGSFVDFSAFADSNTGVDAFLDFKKFSYEKEKGVLKPQFVTSLSEITLDNTDNWLDGADFNPRMPNGIKTPLSKFNTTPVLDINDYINHGTTAANYTNFTATNSKMNSVSGNFSIMGWFNFRTIASSSVCAFISTRTGGSRAYKGFLLARTNANDFIFQICNNTYDNTTASGKVTCDGWHHWAVTVSWNGSTSVIIIYKDGVIQIAGNPTIKMGDSTGYMDIGGNETGTYGETCQMASLKYFNEVTLTGAQILADYNNGIGVPVRNENNLTFGLKMNDGGTTLSDVSPNNIIFTVQHTSYSWPTYMTDIPTRRHNYAFFKLTRGHLAKAWKGRRVRFTIQSQLLDGTYDEDRLATFFIKNTKNSGNKKVFTLESISNILGKTKADSITNSGSWYENPSMEFLITKLLKLKLEGSDLTLPSTYIIPDNIEKMTAETIRQRKGEIDSNLDTRVLSHLGRPPEFQGLTADGAFMNSGGLVTAMCLWSYNTGTVSPAFSSSAGPVTTLEGVSTDWYHIGGLRPIAGDAIIIDDPTNTNSGTYEIKDVVDDTNMTLLTPLKGRTTKLPYVDQSDSRVHFKNRGTMNYSVTRIYMAVSYFGLKDSVISELWKYVPALDRYTKLMTIEDVVSNIEIGSGGILKLQLAKNGEENLEYLTGLYFNDLCNFTNYTDELRDHRTTEGGFIKFGIKDGEVDSVGSGFSFDDSRLMKTISTVDYYPQLGFHHFRHGQPLGENFPLYPKRVIGPRVYGNDDDQRVAGGDFISIPFSQCVGNIMAPDFYSWEYDEGGGNRILTTLRKFPWFFWGLSGSHWSGDTDRIYALAGTMESYYLETLQNVAPAFLIPGTTTDYYEKTDDIAQGYYSIEYDHMLRARFEFRYSSGQKGVFDIHPGEVGNASAIVQAGGPFYYTYDSGSLVIDTGDIHRVAKSCLCTPSGTSSTRCDILDTMYFFSLGVAIDDDESDVEDYNLHPTFLKVYRDSSTTLNEVLIGFMRFDDSISDPNSYTYPFGNNTKSYVYRCMWEILPLSTTTDYTSSFVDSLGKRLGTGVSYSGGATVVLSSVTNLYVNDIIRIHDADGIYYGRITAIDTGTKTVTLMQADGVTSGANGTGTVGTGANGYVNVVARCVYESNNNATWSKWAYSTPLEARKVGGNVWISLLKRGRINTSEQYIIGSVPWNGSYNNLYNYNHHQNQPEGLLETVNELDSDESGNGLLLYFSGGLIYTKDSSGNLTVKGKGLRAIDDEMFLACNPILDSNTRKYASSLLKDHDIIYGISSPTGLYQTQLAPKIGKYYLYKLDTHISLRIPLADFENMNVWEVLSQLAQKSNHIMGFIGDDFWFIPRVLVEEELDTPDFTFYYNDGVHKTNVKSISDIDFGEEDIKNIVSVTPSRIKMNDPEVNFTFKPRNIPTTSGEILNKYEPAVEISVNQRDTLKKSIKLSCLNSGFISQSDTPNTHIGNSIKFRYLITQKEWETTLFNSTSVSDIASTGYITISSGAQDIKVGDILEISIHVESEIESELGTTYVGEYIVDQYVPYADALTGRVHVTLNSWSLDYGSTTEIPVGTTIVVRPNSKWSDYNRNLLLNSDFEFWVPWSSGLEEAPENWELYGFLTIEKKTDTPYSGSSYIKIIPGNQWTSYIKQDVTLGVGSYKFSLIIRGYFGGLSFGGPDSVITYDEGFGTINTYYSNWTEIRGTVTTTTSISNIQIYPYGGSLDVDTVILTEEKYINREYLSIALHDQYYEIGNSKVFIKFHDENEGNYGDNENQETKFQTGDIITITCDGLELEDNKNSIQVARDITSIALYGEQDESITNKFMTILDARETSQEGVRLFKYPRMGIEIETEICPGLSPINKDRKRPIYRVDVVSHKHFSNFPNDTFRGILYTVEYNKTGTVLQLRGINTY
jgi:hypothetical protein